ncbi:MAG: methylmalonyl-CoA mutase family protein [Azoarcus sp.]|jgi:hypothetical protein|nr:methylmalonyl-CoA mutase family protein [Azoarcus sp.]
MFAMSTHPNAKQMPEPAAWAKTGVGAFAGRPSFFWGAGMDFYLEIAKMRAAPRPGSRARTTSSPSSAA